VLPAGLVINFSIALLRHAFAQCQSGVPALPRMVRRESRSPQSTSAGRSRKEYVSFMGGAEAVLERARASFAEGDYRWVVESSITSSSPIRRMNRSPLASRRPRNNSGFQSESGPWRDFYLPAPWNCDRTHGLAGLSGNALASGIVSSMTPELLARLDRSSSQRSEVRGLRDRGRTRRRGSRRRAMSFGVRHGVLHARRDVRTSAPVGVISSIAAFRRFRHGFENFDELIAREDFEVTAIWLDCARSPRIWTCSSSVSRSCCPESASLALSTMR